MTDAPTGLADLLVPPHEGAAPVVLESTVRAAMHGDRSPGTVLAICHPLRLDKVPRGVFEGLQQAGYDVRLVETLADREASIAQIRDALVEARATDGPLDLLVISGDGSLDHHVLVAAFWAFYPNLVRTRAGEVSVRPPDAHAWASLPAVYARWLQRPLPTGEGVPTDERTIHALWVLRAKLAPMLARERDIDKIAAKLGYASDDPRLRLGVLAALLPTWVTLRADGFDLEGLAAAAQEHAFQGLYPFIRAIAVYPAGTAADNALYAGVPGWTYAQLARKLAPWSWLHGLRDRLEARAKQHFLDFFLRDSVVVPARFSVVAFDGAWHWLCSHAAGGPGGGRFFAPDLEAKTGGVLGYLKRIPSVVIGEGLLGSTSARVRTWRADGTPKLDHRGRLVEGLYTNRTFIAAVGSVPSTNPTSFVGQSSFVLAPPLFTRANGLDLTGLLSFIEAISKGVLARGMHLLGLGTGRLAGGGRFWFASPENQLTLTEGELLDVRYEDAAGRPRFVPTQVSGDPFQATSMTLRVAWGPLPMLASTRSLLLAAAQRSLARLRQTQTWQLTVEFIGGLPWFRHDVGQAWTDALAAHTGVVEPPRTLPRRLDRAQRKLLDRWEALGTGPFVDTTEQGLSLGRRGRYAHTSDQAAHLVVVRDRGGVLLVRQVRRAAASEAIYEARTTYRKHFGAWVVHERQLRRWSPDEPPVIVSETRWFRDADAFQHDAPSFFPFIRANPEQRVWTEVTEEGSEP